jgi:hypothetical protein
MNALSIGSAGVKVTSIGGEAKVIGVTSRGLFLSIDQRVLCVSFERWRGPLTINVERPFDSVMGEGVRLSSTRLFFPAIEVDLSTANVWQAPGASAASQSPDEQLRALRCLAHEVLARNSGAGFGALLAHLLDLPEKQALSTLEAALLARLVQLRQSIRHADFEQAADLIEGLLGLGRGLTPSGDDITIGLLLMLNRWQRERDWRELNQCVIALADQRTTTLSANLIECAAEGKADERLINVVDGMVTGTPSIKECVGGVLDWGHSSGRDVLVGLAIALDNTSNPPAQTSARIHPHHTAPGLAPNWGLRSSPLSTDRPNRL